ncbi:MAG: hypothetical protein IPK99_16040 [Flavobacteriales bacterium]|nr:hypothetical protein [Flavobacteriales bacterium]
MFERGAHITPELTIQFHIKSGANADTYRVRNEKGELFFLKIFHREQMEADDLTTEGAVREVELLRGVAHGAIIRFVASGRLDRPEGPKRITCCPRSSAARTSRNGCAATSLLNH